MIECEQDGCERSKSERLMAIGAGWLVGYRRAWCPDHLPTPERFDRLTNIVRTFVKQWTDNTGDREVDATRHPIETEADEIFRKWGIAMGGKVEVTQDNYNPEGLDLAKTVHVGIDPAVPGTDHAVTVRTDGDQIFEIRDTTKPVFTADAIERVRDKRCPSSWCGCHVEEMLGVLTLQDLRDAMGET